jgi:pyruvate/2-oxoglutarate dehydrogenase complex dihydrolipoamide acyltransferase (E2) component
MEDLPAPSGWAGTLDRLEFKPSRKVLMRALHVIAGSRPECSPSNAAIRSAIAGLGYDPPGDRQISVLLRLLEVDDRMLRRGPNERTGSQRRIHFLFLREGADDLRPWAQTTCAPGRRRPAPLGADDLRPASAQVPMFQVPAPEPVSPLNSIQNSEEEKTLTLGTPPDPGSDLTHRGDHAQRTMRLFEIMERLARIGAQVDAEQAQKPAPAAQVVRPASPPPSPHVETVDRLRRLASPCGAEAVEAAAEQVAHFLGDEHSIAYHRSVCERVRRGEIPANVVISAFRKAQSPGALVPGAVFNDHIREHSPPRAAQKPTPGATCQGSPGVGHKSSIQSSSFENKYTRRVNP